MKRLLPLFCVPLILTLALVAAPGAVRPAYAANCSDDHRVMGGSYTLPKGQQLDSNLIVMGGSATIESGAVLNCNLVTVGGSVDLAGSVAGDMVVIGGDIQLRSTAVIDGQLVTFGGSVDRAEGAQVKGGESQGFGPSGNDPGTTFQLPGRLAPLSLLFDLYGSVLHTVLVSIGLGLLALLVVLFWPDQTARVGAAVVGAPAAAGGVALLTEVAVPMLIALAAITICLIPVSFVGSV
ncbi:MAG: polymer-forming cytoskeletal protein, partial [Anaerolineales bacterium]